MSNKKSGKIITVNKKLILFFFIFFFSRFFFINTNAVFFDSGEYIHLFSQTNYLFAIASGHFPPHEGYIIVFWPIFQLTNFLHGNGAYAIILTQIILSFFTLLCFFAFIKYIVNEKTAFFATIIASLTPLFWIIDNTLMMENAYAFFFFCSLFLLTRYLTKNTKEYLLHISLLFFMLAILTQPIVATWAPLYLCVTFFKQKRLLKKIFLFFVLYFAVFSLLNILFIATILNLSIPTTFHYVYLSKGGEFAELPFNFKGLFVALRNFFVPLFANNTILIIILSFISLLIAFRKEKKIFFYGIFFILPALYANQWWDSLLPGRHALITGFGMAFLTAYLIKKKNIYCYVIILYLLFVSIPTLNLLKKPIPYLQDAQFAATVPKDSLFIESHFARPQVQTIVKGRAFYVNEPGYSVENLKEKITAQLAEKKPIFITSAALSEPYALYSGPYLHSLSLSYEHPYFLQPLLTNYNIKLYKTLNAQDNLLIYKIIANTKAPYPSIKNMKDSHRRLNYYDPFWQATWWLETIYFHQK